MVIIEKVWKFIKPYSSAVAAFFTEEDKAARTSLRKMDLADIFIALLPAAIFSCLLFGWRAVITLALCVAVCLLTDFLWNIIFKKNSKEINYSVILTGFILGLTLSSRLSVIFTIILSVLTTVLIKTVFRNKPLYIIFPILITRVVFSLVFSGAFSVYSLPFISQATDMIPLDSLFKTLSFVPPAKYLFFGLHSGNIGEISEFLIIVGAMYLLLRKTINPLISSCYIITLAVLSLIFGESLAVSLLGGGLMFAALFLTIDYGFISTPRYKKILYGVCCGVLTFVIRWLLKTEGAICAVLICNIIFIYVNRRNIKRAIKFFKNPDFKKLLNKAKKVLGI